MSALYGILGWPVAHSRSPAMHNAAFAELGLDAVYVRFAVRPERLADAVRGLDALGVQGANVTLPHKQAVMALLDEVTPDARAIGAVNTLVRAGDRWVGHNTDAPGLARSLEEAHVPLVGADVVVLGAGGAARASVVGLARAGARSIVVCARRPEEATALVQSLAPLFSSARLVASDMSQASLAAHFEHATLLVQSTSATLESAADPSGFAAQLPIAALPSRSAVIDLVYKPRITSVLAAAHARGLAVVDGLGMLLHQGALAFELWTGRPAPLGVMRAALSD